MPFREPFLPVLVVETGGDLRTATRNDLKGAFGQIVRLFKMRCVLS